MTWLLRLIAGHWIALLSTKLLIAGAVAGVGWVYHLGAAHERAHQAAEALRIEQSDLKLREKEDASILDRIRAGTILDGLQPYYRTD